MWESINGYRTELSRTGRKTTSGQGNLKIGTASIKYKSGVLGWVSSILIILWRYYSSIWITKTMMLAIYTICTSSLHHAILASLVQFLSWCCFFKPTLTKLSEEAGRRHVKAKKQRDSQEYPCLIYSAR